jgi:hypothetical protein
MWQTNKSSSLTSFTKSEIKKIGCISSLNSSVHVVNFCISSDIRWVFVFQASDCNDLLLTSMKEQNTSN